jgi:putative transcriptional regulator
MIQVNLDVMMGKAKNQSQRAVAAHGNFACQSSILKNNKCRAIRFSTLSKLCRNLECEVSDILFYMEGEEEDGTAADESTKTDR